MNSPLLANDSQLAQSMGQRVVAWCLGAVLLTGVGLRCDGLIERSLWFDEASAYITATKFGWAEMLERSARNVHPPLFYVVLRLWTATFGETTLGLRSLSVALAAATMLGAYILARDSYRVGRSVSPETDATARGIGVTAAAFVAVASYQIVWSQQARMYSLGTCLTVFASWALLRVMFAEAARGWWVLYSLLAAALMYTHNYGLFTVFAHVVFVLGWVIWRSARGHAAGTVRVVRRAGLAFAAAGILYLPWVSALIGQTNQVRADYWSEPLTWTTIPEEWFQLFFPREDAVVRDHAPAVLWAGLLISTLAVAAVGARPGEWLLLTIAIVPVACAVAVSLAVAPIVTTRYFLFAQVGVLCALADLLWRHLRPPWVGLGVILLLLNGLYLHGLHRSDLNVAGRPGLRGLVERVLRDAEVDAPIVVVHPALYHAALYHVGNRAEVWLYVADREPAHYHGAPILTGEEFISARELREIDADRIWVIDTTGFNIGFSRAPLPDPWRPVAGSTITFEEVFRFQRGVSGTLHERLPASVPENPGQ